MKRVSASYTTDQRFVPWLFSHIVSIYCILDVLWLTLVKGVWFNRKRRATSSSLYPPLVDTKRELYTNYIYFGTGIQECVERVVVGAPTVITRIVKPHANVRYGGNSNTHDESTKCINVGPYNYLGYAGRSLVTEDTQVDSMVSTCCSVAEGGVASTQHALERELASFLNKEAALVFPMGWDTNVSVLPLLIDRETLVFSDEKNHSSIASGCKLARCKKLVCFKNADAADLDRCIREELYGGDQATAVTYSKIVIIVEGIYSMDGTMLAVRDFIRVKRRYNAYLYIDEAHSIGAVGFKGRGVCALSEATWQKYTNEVDVLMGTFTKSFSSIGGYVAASNEVIRALTARCTNLLYDTALAPTSIAQIRGVLRELLSGESSAVEQLDENTAYLRAELTKRGLDPMGDEASPVVPILTHTISRMTHVARHCFEHGVAVVVAGYPATDISSARIRLCVSASHTKEQLDRVVDVLEEAMKWNWRNLREIYRIHTS